MCVDCCCLYVFVFGVFVVVRPREQRGGPYVVVGKYRCGHIYLYLYMYVCMLVCLYVCLYVCVFIYIYILIWVYMGDVLLPLQQLI